MAKDSEKRPSPSVTALPVCAPAAWMVMVAPATGPVGSRAWPVSVTSSSAGTFFWSASRER